MQGRTRALVEGLRDARSSTHPVATARRNGQAELSICHPDLIAGLIARSMGSNKTVALTWPETGPDRLLRHYLRGYSDGYGCFYV